MSSPRTNYIEKAVLAARIGEYQRTGRMSDELVTDLKNLAAGVHDRFGYPPSKDDFIQECFVHFLGAPLRRADPGKNCFGWLTTCAVRFGNKQRAKLTAERANAATYSADMAYLMRGSLEDAGRDQPEDLDAERPSDLDPPGSFLDPVTAPE